MAPDLRYHCIHFIVIYFSTSVSRFLLTNRNASLDPDTGPGDKGLHPRVADYKNCF